MRVLFTCTQGTGHLHPLIPIASAMAVAGHEVAFASPRRFASSIERSGFRSFPSGMAETASEAFPEMRGLRGVEEMVFTQTRVRPAQAAAMAQDLTGVISKWRPAVLIRETSEFGGCIAAEFLGVPYAVVEVLATGLSDDRRSLLSNGLAPVLAQYGLPPDPA